MKSLHYDIWKVVGLMRGDLIKCLRVSLGYEIYHHYVYWELEHIIFLVMMAGVKEYLIWELDGMEFVYDEVN
jgi:hypothetical protein